MVESAGGLKVMTSSSFNQYIPRALPSSFSPVSDTSVLGSVARRSIRLLAHFLRWNSPLLRNIGTLRINAATSDSSSQLITKSSTYMLDRARLITSSHSSGFRSACALITFIARYGEHANPKHTRVRRYARTVAFCKQLRHRKRQASRSSTRSVTCSLHSDLVLSEAEQNTHQISLQIWTRFKALIERDTTVFCRPVKPHSAF
ncbi:hypothetical protein T11_10243 [Trichinella zimbabwensis]|uniref:Uncharacterized protein n=1 Tax=Trichinella zimbabwensis TaxID=268475 RepID=A0A0V1HEJ0_9BILA|nr:hypothetical protein T11_10243 [Trichinella zimbabwensis]